ncbi:hypothetical protein QTP70_000925 [Hemibagrus guttatus]|uniref:Ig-like domain-containing protein n=1 Tax=Hemibagrus guttatus TaxID=175788 RepID=A0AAE0PQV5_9TELE|nr:hypothetical protein QTP70_000925 [Hemibagrus guttatus]
MAVVVNPGLDRSVVSTLHCGRNNLVRIRVTASAFLHHRLMGSLTMAGDPVYFVKHYEKHKQIILHRSSQLWKLGDSMADSIEPLFTHNVVDEGDDVTLSCKYKTSYTGNIYLHWYRQYPTSHPKFLLYIDTRGSKSDPIPPRLNANVDKNMQQVDLIISSAAVSDSALYYCALEPTVTGNPAALYKNVYTV